MTEKLTIKEKTKRFLLDLKKEIEIGSCIFWITGIFSLVLAALLLLEFFTRGKVRPFYEMVNIYLFILSVYVVQKELHRWLSNYTSQRLGELFVVKWWSILLIMIVIIQLEPFIKNSETYYLPQDMLTVCFGVIYIYLSSLCSKVLNARLISKKSN